MCIRDRLMASMAPRCEDAGGLHFTRTSSIFPTNTLFSLLRLLLCLEMTSCLTEGNSLLGRNLFWASTSGLKDGKVISPSSEHSSILVLHCISSSSFSIACKAYTHKSRERVHKYIYVKAQEEAASVANYFFLVKKPTHRTKNVLYFVTPD